MVGSREARMRRQIFKKIALSEKKHLFQEGAKKRITFHAKGDGDELITLILTEFDNEHVLTLEYAASSPKLLAPQNVIFNFSHEDDRYFFQTQVDVYQEKVMIPARIDIFILQRRKAPRLDLPTEFPAGFNIIELKNKSCMYECQVLDFSSGGCRVQYSGHLPIFKVGDQLKGVLHLSHRRPMELSCEIKHHVLDKDKGLQVFGVQFLIKSSLLENRLLVLFMDLQRELFTKYLT